MNTIDLQSLPKGDVVLVVDELRALKSLRDLLKQTPLRLIAEEIDTKSGWQSIRSLKPDVAIISMNNSSIARQIKKTFPKTWVIVVRGMDCTANDLSKSSKRYVDAFLFEPTIHHFVLQINRIIKNKGLITAESFVIEANNEYQQKARSITLTYREEEILRRLTLGHDIQKIAIDLTLAITTVKSYLRQIYNKLDVQSMTEAVVMALRGGLVT